MISHWCSNSEVNTDCENMAVYIGNWWPRPTTPIHWSIAPCGCLPTLNCHRGSSVNRWLMGDRWVTAAGHWSATGQQCFDGNYPIKPPQAWPVCQLLTNSWPMVDQPAKDSHGGWWTESQFHRSVCQPSTDGVRGKIELSTASGCSWTAINFTICPWPVSSSVETERNICSLSKLATCI